MIFFKFQASIAMSLCDNNPDSEVMNLSQKYQCTVFYGNALYHLQEYHKAEVSHGRSQWLGLYYIFLLQNDEVWKDAMPAHKYKYKC